MGVPARRKLTNTASPASFEIARHWIRKCRQSHNCGAIPWFLSKEYSREQWPSRLVEVSFFGSTSEDIRLVDVLQLKSCPDYTTLSYCWGLDRNLHERYITTTARLASRLERIQFSILPQTLKDSIQICRKLGFQYIWIDALCIIQDSESDWLLESAKMASIYARCLLTIAVDNSSSANGGCFNRRSSSQAAILKREIHFFKLTCTLSSGQRSTLYINGTNPISGHLISLGPWLEGRAWTFQERILSPRILHYAPDQLFWECRQEYQAEDEMNLWYIPSDHSTMSGMLLKLSHFDPNPERNKLLAICTWYFDILGPEYSSRALTRATDKLAAIAGLARAVYPAIQSRYLAGLWLDKIHIGLGWEIMTLSARELGSTYFKRLDNGSPSWSWASCGLQVTWPGVSLASVEKERSLISVEDVDIPLHGADPFGGVRGGRLTISGRVRQVRIRRSDEYQSLMYLLRSDGTEVGQGTLDQWEFFDSLTCLLISKNEGSSRGSAILLHATGRAPEEYERKGFTWGINLNFFKDSPMKKVILV